MLFYTFIAHYDTADAHVEVQIRHPDTVKRIHALMAVSAEFEKDLGKGEELVRMLRREGYDRDYPADKKVNLSRGLNTLLMYHRRRNRKTRLVTKESRRIPVKKLRQGALNFVQRRAGARKLKQLTSAQHAELARTGALRLSVNAQNQLVSQSRTGLSSNGVRPPRFPFRRVRRDIARQSLEGITFLRRDGSSFVPLGPSEGNARETVAVARSLQECCAKLGWTPVPEDANTAGAREGANVLHLFICGDGFGHKHEYLELVGLVDVTRNVYPSYRSALVFWCAGKRVLLLVSACR